MLIPESLANGEHKSQSLVGFSPAARWLVGRSVGPVWSFAPVKLTWADRGAVDLSRERLRRRGVSLYPTKLLFSHNPLYTGPG